MKVLISKIAILMVVFLFSVSASAGSFPNTKAGWDAASEEVRKKLEALHK